MGWVVSPQQGNEVTLLLGDTPQGRIEFNTDRTMLFGCKPRST